MWLLYHKKHLLYIKSPALHLASSIFKPELIDSIIITLPLIYCSWIYHRQNSHSISFNFNLFNFPICITKIFVRLRYYLEFVCFIFYSRSHENLNLPVFIDLLAILNLTINCAFILCGFFCKVHNFIFYMALSYIKLRLHWGDIFDRQSIQCTWLKSVNDFCIFCLF